MPALTAPATPLALSAFEAGYIAGRLLFAVLGVTLIVVGLVRRARSKRAESAAWPAGAGTAHGAASPAPGWHGAAGWSGPAGGGAPGAAGAGPAASQPVPDGPAAAPGQAVWGVPAPAGPGGQSAPAWAAPPAARPAGRAGTGLVVAGVVLLGLFVVSAVGSTLRGAPGEPVVERQVALPATVLGLPKDEASTADFAEAADAAEGAAGVDGLQGALYTDGTDFLVVTATAVRITDLEGEVQGYRSGAEADLGPLGDGVEVDPGPLGGVARCWTTTYEQEPLATCVFVDGGSLMATIDFDRGDVQAAADRGREARSAVVAPS